MTTLSCDMEVCVPYVSSYICTALATWRFIVQSPATCLQKRRMSTGNGRPHSVDIIQFYRILTMGVTLVITRSLEVSGICPSSRYAKETEYEKTTNRQNLTSIHDVSVHM